MSLSVPNRKILWGRSGNRCAFPGCNQELHEIIGKEGSTIVGEECHIEAQSEGGPRFNEKLNSKQIDSYENVILLCPTHHRIIDDNPQKYTVDVLNKMKTEHEERVRRSLEDKSEYDDLYYESIVAYIEVMLDFDNWDAWTSFLLSADGPMCTDDMLDCIDIISHYILGRVWDGRYPKLENSIKTFRIILTDLLDVFYRHSESKQGWQFTEKFYKIKPYNYKIAHQLAEEYREHMRLVNNLVFEMTRAANQICDLTRKFVNNTYRRTEGKLIIYNKCPEYKEDEYYPGLEKFAKICRTRDVYV